MQTFLLFFFERNFLKYIYKFRVKCLHNSKIITTFVLFDRDKRKGARLKEAPNTKTIFKMLRFKFILRIGKRFRVIISNY